MKSALTPGYFVPFWASRVAPDGRKQDSVPTIGRTARSSYPPRSGYRKITWRLIPYLFLLYILAYLDRVNVGFAAIEFQRDLHLSATVFGLGGGIYFVGQLLFDLPSNLLLTRVGPRRWIARIMISWGIVATGMASR